MMIGSFFDSHFFDRQGDGLPTVLVVFSDAERVRRHCRQVDSTPLRCTNRLVPPQDHASVQFRIAKLNADGLPTGEYETIVFSGYLRTLGEADNALNRIATERGLLTGVYRE
jgi:small subunit ribosomal protein S21e